MIKMIKILYILFACTLFSQESHEFSGTKAANWLKIETGTRAIGMSGAHTAAGRGITSIQYNPSSITHIDGTELYYTQSKYILGISKNVLGYGLKLASNNYFGMNLFYLNSGDIEVTTEQTPSGTGEMYQVTNFCLNTVYGRQINERIRAGVTLKVIREDIYTAYMNSYAFDFGGTYQLAGLMLGFSINNVGPQVKFYGQGLDQAVSSELSVDEKLARVSESFDIPTIARLGISTSSPIEVMGSSFLLACDLVKPSDNSFSLNTGMEYSWEKTVFLRAGYHLGHDSGSISGGLGLKWKAIELDVAYAHYQTFNTVHYSSPYQIGLIFSF